MQLFPGELGVLQGGSGGGHGRSCRWHTARAVLCWGPAPEWPPPQGLLCFRADSG